MAWREYFICMFEIDDEILFAYFKLSIHFPHGMIFYIQGLFISLFGFILHVAFIINGNFWRISYTIFRVIVGKIILKERTPIGI